MNRLWVRLTLAIGLIIILSLITVSALANYRVNNQFRQFIADNQMAGSPLVENLGVYYQQQGSWQGIDQALRDIPQGGGPPPNANWDDRLRRANLILADANGQVVQGRGMRPGQRLNRADLNRAVPILVDDEIAGYLLFRPPEPAELAQPEQTFLQQLNRILIGGGLIAAGLGIVLGFVVARNLTAPLNKLALAAHEISGGKLGRQVPVEGPKEIADLTSAFNDMSVGLAEAETLRRNMVADVAHELRTPLTVLQGNLRAILDDVYPLDKEEIARLYDQTGHLSRLVNDLHELAQAEAHQLALSPQPLNLVQFVEDTCAQFAPLAEADNIKLETNLPAQSLSLHADKARLRQVMNNLLSNALRHTPAGGKIGVAVQAENNRAIISVSDTGEGIDPKHLPYIFDRFYRTDPARSRDTGGAGLGLAITKAIIQAHGGQISAHSDGLAGHGTTFTIQLPLS